jgi:hypothetical protein
LKRLLSNGNMGRHPAVHGLPPEAVEVNRTLRGSLESVHNSAPAMHGKSRTC